MKIFILFFITVNSNSAITNFSKGTSHEGDVYWKHRKITLPPENGKVLKDGVGVKGFGMQHQLAWYNIQTTT